MDFPVQKKKKMQPFRLAEKNNPQPTKGLGEDEAWEAKVKALVVQSERKNQRAEEQM